MAQQYADKTITLSTQQDFPLGMILATLFKGKALAEQGELATGIAAMRRQIRTCEAIGLGIFRSMTLLFLSTALGAAGEIEEALAVVAKGLAFVAESGEKLWEAELYRLKGELLRQQGADASEVAQQFQQALAIARSQQAKSLELRAAVSLSRLWQAQGRIEEARHRLAEVYGWFSEGFDTDDLIEAKGLLDQLEQ